MANANTAHSKKLRAKTAREANQRRLDEGGMRISILLNADEARRFTPLVSREGGIKKAFLALLAQAGMPETAPGTPSPEEAVSTDKEDTPR
nr:hypothetical protein [uncultured Cardiobacterium sp.]